MEHQLDMMSRILALADTALEGLDHVHRQQLEGNHPAETTALFADVVYAFAQIEEAIRRFPPSLEHAAELMSETDSLREGLRWMTAAYEGTSDVSPLATLQFTLLPRFKSWHEALQQAIRPHLAS